MPGRRGINAKTKVYLGQRVKDFREARGWSVQELASELGVKWSSIDALESGENGATLRTLLEICRALNIPSLEELLGGTTVLRLMEFPEDRRK